MSAIPQGSGTKVPYRVDRSAPGVVTIEKRYDDFNPNCVLGVLVIVLSIIVPAALAAISPLASVSVFVGSLFFPGVPIGLMNKKWRIEINNISNQMHVSRWHDFNKKLKKVSAIKFDDIKEIIAEASADGTRHRLVIIDQANARHLLYETMNKAHASRFKDDFMQSIELARSPGSTASHGRMQPTLTMRAPVVAPMLRQFAVPELNEEQDLLPNMPNHHIPQDVSSTLAQNGGISDPVGNLSTSSARMGEHGVFDDDVHSRLVAIAQHKREVLERVFEPGQGDVVGASAAMPDLGDNGAGNGTDPVCPHLRNTSEMFDIFDPCFASMNFIPHEIAGRATEAPRVLEDDIQDGPTPKKKNHEGEEVVITHHIDKKTEKELGVQKIRPTCMVCTIPLKGTNFICPTCETKYCIRCARTLSARKEYCWTCRKPIKLQ